MKKQVLTTVSIIAIMACSQASAQTYSCGHGRAGNPGSVADAPGAAAYGAQDEADRMVVVHIDGLLPYESSRAYKISPWHRIDGFDGDRPISYPGVGHVSDGADGTYSNAYTRGLDKIADRLEDARKQWLRDNGYVGVVRVFKSTSPAAKNVEGAGLPEPRGIIVVPDSVKRQKTRFQVQADEPTSDEAREGGAVRISRPPMMRVSTVRVVVPKAVEEQEAPTQKLLADAGN